MQNDDMPDPLGPLSKQLNVCLNFRSSPMKCPAVTRPSHRDLTLFIPQRDGRIVMHSTSLEEGYSIPLVLMLFHYRYCSTFHPLAFDLMLRVHVDNGFALFQIHGPDNLEIHQL